MHCCGRIPGAYERCQRPPVSCRGISGACGGPGQYYTRSASEWQERRPSLVDGFTAVPKVNNLRWGGGNPVEIGSATLPIKFVSPPSPTSPMEDLQPRVLPNQGGDPEVATGSELVFASHPRIQSPMVVHESHNILCWMNPHRHHRSLILLVLFPLCRHPAPARRLTWSECKESRT